MSQQDDSEKIEGEVPTSEQFEDIVSSTIEQFEVLDVLDLENTMLIQPTQPIVYQIVYQEPLVLTSNPESAKKRGRPRKSQNKPKSVPEPTEPLTKTKVVISKTRSGREVKLPKHIQQDFESLEVESDIVASDLQNTNEEHEVTTTPPIHIELQQKKRKIAAQYRCPKCQKAYLGRNKMLQHLKKHPSHGPVNQKPQNHFEVWNYLVSLTQKCPSSERGTKFCQELSNLLHNLLLLTNALFKKIGNPCNEVQIDKVLGNAIGLSPGPYYFDDNNLYKDVTVLQLMENTDFLGSLKSKLEVKDCHCNGLKSKKILEKNDCDYAKNAQILEEIESAQPIIDSKNNEGFDFSLNNYIDISPKPKSPNVQNLDYQIKDSNEEVLIDDALIHPVDELMLPVGSILDNSSSSDEVLNVDQFVNERFRKITESDLDGTSALIPELPPLELFQFHTT